MQDYKKSQKQLKGLQANVARDNMEKPGQNVGNGLLNVTRKVFFFNHIRVEYHDVQCAVCWEMVTTLWRKSSTQLSDVGVLVCSYGFKACYYCSSKGL